MRRRYYLIAIAAAAMLIGFQNCSAVSFTSSNVHAPDAQNNLPAAVTPETGTGSPPDTGTASPAVCNPFSTGPTQSGHGLLATLRYLTKAQVSAEKAAEANNQPLPYGIFSDLYNKGDGFIANPIVVGDLGVENRYFTTGMSDSQGKPVLGSDGTVVTQYFGLSAKGQLVLGSLAPGDYDVATLTDDGSILTIEKASKNGDGTYSDIVINNDGGHSAKMMCTPQTLHLDANSSYNVTLQYFQGMPVTIAIMVMLKPHDPAGYVADPQCGKGGNEDRYFMVDNDDAKPVAHPISPPTRQQPYLDVLGRGWVPLANANLLLPPNSAVTGCQ